MSATTKIEWTDATWSPIRMRNGGDFLLANKTLTAPLRRRKPTRYAMPGIDLFHEIVPDEWIDRVFSVMALAPQHRFMVRTKNSRRMREYLVRRAGDWMTIWPDANPPGLLPVSRHEQRLRMGESGADVRRVSFPLPNVWLGVSVEDQARADERIPDLLATPAAVRWVSAEPLLGAIKLTRLQQSDGSEIDSLYGSIWCPGAGSINSTTFRGRTRLDWVVVGGESGRGARPMHPDWVRAIRDQCAAADVPFFFKQWGNWLITYDRDRDDPDWTHCEAVASGDPKGRWLNLAGGHGFHGARVVRATPTTTVCAGRLLDGLTHDAYPEN